MSRAVLVTGTDTGVGKTLVGSAIAAALAPHARVGVFKPAETGCAEKDGELVPDDALRLRTACRRDLPLELVCPFRYAEPLAPFLAAVRAGRPISLATLDECFAKLRAESDVVLVESAGGLLVPLLREVSFADLAARLRLAVLVVVGNRLGALNAALLTIECARRRGLEVEGWVLNDLSAGRDLAQRTNAAALASLTDAPCVGEVPFVVGAAELSLERLAAIGEPLARALGFSRRIS